VSQGDSMVQSRLRLIIALILAPAVPILLASALAVLAGSPSWHPVSLYVDRSDPNHPLLVDGPRFIGALPLFAIYATTTLIGLALYLFIRRFRDVTGNVCIAGGILTGVIFMLLISDLAFGPVHSYRVSSEARFGARSVGLHSGTWPVTEFK